MATTGADRFCKGVLLGNLLLSNFGRRADTENSAFTRSEPHRIRTVPV